MRLVLVSAVLVPFAFGQSPRHAAGNRTTPPALASVSPKGISRGVSTELTIEGLNLADAKAIYFNRPGLSGHVIDIKELPDTGEPVLLGAGGLASSIDRGPLPPRHRVTVEVDVRPDAEIGPVGFRLLTHLGTTPAGQILIEPYYGESSDREPNNSAETAFDTYTPTILVGAISYPGDVDYYKLSVKAGETLVFEDGAQSIGSSLDAVVAIFDRDGAMLSEHRGGGDVRHGFSFAQQFKTAGAYYLRISDAQEGGNGDHFYRIKVGKFPLLTSIYPLGVRAGESADIKLTGYHLGIDHVNLPGLVAPDVGKYSILRPETPFGKTLNRFELAVGDDPELASTGTNTNPSEAEQVSVPVMINGRLARPHTNGAAENYFRFPAKKGEKLILETIASRLGSKLDSLLEVLDNQGRPIERATLRAVQQAFTSILERDSATPGIFLSSLDGLAIGDYLMIGEEVIRIDDLPAQSCLVVTFSSVNGQRAAYFDTTAEAHGLDEPAYKVLVLPPGGQFRNNGLPVRHLYYRNDDGGSGLGKDSLLHFTAPADGDYIARIRDLTGSGGPDYTFRLSIRRPKPDFEISVSPKNPNVPAGGRIPLTVMARRLDEFDGPIGISLEDLPAGFHASTGIIPAGQVTTTLLLSAESNATLSVPARLRVIGRATIGGHVTTHRADAEEDLMLISAVPKADIFMAAEATELTLSPGGRKKVTVTVERNNAFHGRVLVEVRNLPPGVRVIDVGLNGIVIEPNESLATFEIEAFKTAKPVRQPIYISGRIETRSPLQNSYAAAPISLTLKTLKP